MQELVLIQPGGTADALRRTGQRPLYGRAGRRRTSWRARQPRLTRGVSSRSGLPSAARSRIASPAAYCGTRRRRGCGPGSFATRLSPVDRLRDRNRFRPGWFESRFGWRLTVCVRETPRTARHALVAAGAPAASSDGRGHCGFERISSPSRKCPCRIPEKLRLVLLLAAMEGHTIEEIAALVGIPVGP